MDSLKGTELKKAKVIIERLLKYRLRSEQEVVQKLKSRKISDKTIEDVIQLYKSLGLINDREFSRIWISSRLKKPFGSRRIRLELTQKGVSKDILQEELNQATQDFPETEIALELARRRAAKYKDVDEQKLKSRIYGYLSRRGFNPQTIMKVIKEL